MEPTNRIAQARKDAHLAVKELAEMLNVDTSTLHNWETGRRQLTLDRLTQISKVLGASVTYLLGIDEQVNYLEPVKKNMLPILHRMPVWTGSYGWALVNALNQSLVFIDKSEIPFGALQENVYMVPLPFTFSLRCLHEPLSIRDILSSERVWVEPISADPDLASELRGWYRPRERRLVENEFGNRFYLDTYGAKWLSFHNSLDNGGDTEI